MVKKNLMIGIVTALSIGCSFSADASDAADLTVPLASHIANKMDAAMEKVTFFEGSIKLDMPIIMETEGMNMEVPISMNGSIKTDLEGKKAEMNADMTINMLGEEENQKYHLYITEDGLYTQADDENWEYSPTGEEGNSLSAMKNALFQDDDFWDDAVLSSDTGEKDGKECYKMELTIPLDEIQDTFKDFEDLLGDINGNDIEVCTYIGAEDYLLYGIDIGFSAEGPLDDGASGFIKSDIMFSIDKISYDEVAVDIPEDILTTKDGYASSKEDDKNESNETNETRFQFDEDIPISRGEKIYVGEEENSISFIAPNDILDTTYDKSSVNYRSYSIGDGNLSISFDIYSNAKDNYEYDLEYYQSSDNKDNFADVKSFELETPLGTANGVFYHSIWQDATGSTSVSYTSAVCYLDVDGKCYDFEYTVYDDADMEDMTEILGSVLDSVSCK